MNFLSNITPEILALELRSACIHEAGHAVMLQTLGGYGLIEVWRRQTQDIKHKAWGGKYNIVAAPGSIAPSAHLPRLRTAPAHAMAMVGLAGVVAEAIANGYDDADAIWTDIDCRHALSELSASDLDLIGPCWDRHLDEVIAISRAEWSEVLRLSEAVRQDAIAVAGGAA